MSWGKDLVSYPDVYLFIYFFYFCYIIDSPWVTHPGLLQHIAWYKTAYIFNYANCDSVSAHRSTHCQWQVVMFTVQVNQHKNL